MKRLLTYSAWFSSSLALFGCSSPELDGTNFSCASDADCGSGQVCASLNGPLVCQASGTLSPIRIGMVGPLVGPSSDLGKEMVRGIEAMLKPYNAAGGAFGRRVELEKRNDNYNPETAVLMTRELLDVQTVVEGVDKADVRGNASVFAFLGNIGTPTMLATAPVATKNKVVFFAPFTGAQSYLRDETKSPYVYNYRAGYFDETAAMLQYISHERIPSVITNPAEDYKRVLVFAQNDTYGEAGYQGIVKAYNDNVAPLPDPTAIARVGYTREDVASVVPAVEQAGVFLSGVLSRASDASSTERVAIVMIDTYQPGDAFIRGLKNWINEDATRASRLDVLFMNVSFVGSDSLATALTNTPKTYVDIANPSRVHSYAENVIVTQVVPSYDSQAAGVVQYRDDIQAYDAGNLTFTSLEGYIVARLFTEALTRNGPSLSSENFIHTLDNDIEDLDIGIGTELSFSVTNHQASSTVWVSHIEDDGKFTVPFVWNRD
jgi:ABC-type branched-subunit amino acid transport system substrate-binding protein